MLDTGYFYTLTINIIVLNDISALKQCMLKVLRRLITVILNQSRSAVVIKILSVKTLKYPAMENNKVQFPQVLYLSTILVHFP